ncbi:MAG: CYTH domain-containing protein [Deltaproteobacteria bacterium]
MVHRVPRGGHVPVCLERRAPAARQPASLSACPSITHGHGDRIPHEIERKFLVHVDALPPEARTGGASFAQGYLATAPTVRVRLADGGTDRARAWLTIKGPGLVTRSEFEYAIPPADAEAMLGLCRTSLSKIRREVRVGNHVWEVDEFSGAHAGLWLAEIELDHEGEAFERPAWLDREVTTDARYSNSALAQAGASPR